jgi:hypothetical protein
VRLVADASVLVGESLRLRGRSLIADSRLELYIAAPIRSEVDHEIGNRLTDSVQRGRLPAWRRELTYEETLLVLDAHLTLVTEAEYGAYEAEARDRIPRDPNDWPTVALAPTLDIGIWTIDDDFFGCGVPVWTTDTLLTHVAAGRA